MKVSSNMNSTKSAGSSKSTTPCSLSNGAPASGTCEERRLAGVAFQGDTLVAGFTDGSRVSVDVRRFPRLSQATRAERNKWRLIGQGAGVHWEAIDEDLSVENLLFASAKVRA
jgi:hypothetical protein